MDILKPFSLEGRVALITGASSGFGRHFAGVLAKAGAKVVLGARRADRIQSACDEIIDQGGKALAVNMDVTDTDSIKAALDMAQEYFGVVDVVINNAGITIPKMLLDLSDDEWNSVIDTNLNGLAFVTREASKRMIAANVGGSIINIASIVGERVQKALTNYAASKAGVIHFTKAAALELARNDIRVNAICPGYFETELNSAWFATDDGQALIQRIPTRRIGELDELNGPLLLLASEAGSWMTGSTLTVDGGHLLSDL
ncbi:3-oxoacyl-[acyl-carrier-protein] reductase FabG [Sinobacterium norvegicum]|uniref:3-oxoacyl-[acyl-carrier-protein] reductase FabG n=1 Tax=Sinobacterium norvegicum TaxID=1641715 RepID=A0ABM9AJZ7_9GAMM|nr:glucose 1-dehydrogenase [Sinobacterium norvegicum]CAH0993079.1 3-oxoacyl-[acyl-carrier-protein] reductase FabG [Sinobacterium norvegicum]